jgi:very-short-patch-repair endonuclease
LERDRGRGFFSNLNQHMSSFNNNYNKNLKTKSSALRSRSVSMAEKYLWKNILSKGQSGTKFKRQRPINSFIVDFFSQELNLIIEIDGSSHIHKGEQDEN